MSLMESLLKLYRVDAQVRGLQNRLETARRYLAAQDKLLNDQRHVLEELQVRRRQTQARIGNFEGEVATIDQRLEKLRNDLNSSSTNKQYVAIQTELNTVKISRTQLEETILQEMQKVEQIDADIAKTNEAIAERAKVRDLAKAQLEERQAEIGQRLQELTAERDAAASSIPSGELDVFNEIADQYQGEAMAPIEEVDRRHREYACGACNMQMPFEQVSLLMTGSNAIVRCTACGRILYLQDETRGALARK